ncbi:MAG: bifunctional (p)ppGpp synthetase/guanosine-3',5'-bis(diphosphate) 3'-pyrophosphohydrolase [Lachnospiraceae bacterium]|nr:bifunctional (p)ppGpp synthetase/guanosine-3',5'-bis(diphosphate) 3'-pyrophosphohydrolase [Lachnospiraceae bacterium]
MERTTYKAMGEHIHDTGDFLNPEDLYDELLRYVRKYHPSADIKKIEEAYKIASDAHKDQVRKSGEPYIIHPLCVASILAELELDKETIIAGILHDVVEDTIMSLDDIRGIFGDEVALLVDGVTKLGQLSYDASKVELQAENLRKMFLAMAKDIRVILIKLADRLHNMRTLKYMTPEKQKEKARETLDIYAPIAQRLGISKVKIELEDLALKYLEPEAYFDLVKKIAMRRAVRDEYIQGLVKDVRQDIIDAGIEASVEGRSKHFFSIYKKMVSKGKTIDQIYDLFAIRIIVNDVKDCYAALGIIHEKYTPIPGRFKDYIAIPKPNMYQSLHTTLIGPDGKPFEVQIRTYEMHKTSEYGIAAHWKYKENSTGNAVHGEEEKLTWLRHILEWQQEDNEEFLSLLKSDLNLFSDTVFCFTPTGEIKNLPVGSIPVDFAYSIHSAVGNKMVGAKVNGKLVPIDYVIKNGDRVEIITSSNSRGPSRDWLAIVKSTQAKNKINQFFRSLLKEENVQRGRDEIDRYCRDKRIDWNELNTPYYQEKILKKYGFHEWDNCLATIGHGGAKASSIVSKMLEEYRKDHPIVLTDDEVLAKYPGETEARKKTKSINKSGVIVKGFSDMSVKMSKCCSPVPGDDIIGFITRGRGVSIHRRDCINVQNASEVDRARFIEASWDANAEEEAQFTAELSIYASNRTGLLNDISRVFTERGVNIESLYSKTSKQGVATVVVSFETKGKDELKVLIEKLRQIDNVIDVSRTSS